MQQEGQRHQGAVTDAIGDKTCQVPAGGLHDGRLLKRFARTVQAADLVVAGNSYLAEQAACWIAA